MCAPPCKYERSRDEMCGHSPYPPSYHPRTSRLYPPRDQSPVSRLPSPVSMSLGVGFIGSGFNTRFHIQGWRGVRDADVLGVWSPNARNAASAARLARECEVGEAKPYKSIAAMVADPAIDAIWLCGANHARIENVEEIVDAIKRGKGTLKGIACEKPLARNVAEAKAVQRMAA